MGTHFNLKRALAKALALTMCTAAPLSVRMLGQNAFAQEEDSDQAVSSSNKVSIEGRVLVKGSSAPLKGALIFQTDDRKNLAKSAEDGSFKLQIDASANSVTVKSVDYEDLEIEVKDGKLVTGDTIRLEKSSSFREVGIIRAKRKTEISQQSLSRSDLENIAGAGSDPVRGLQTLPSVVSSGGGSAEIVVRGGAPGDNKFFLDRLELPFVYHLGGLGTVVPLRMLSGVDLYAGGFSALYSNATSAIVQLKTENSIPEPFSGEVEVSLLQSSAYVEGNLFRDAQSEGNESSAPGEKSEGVGYRAGFRRTYLELFGPILLKQLGEDLSVTVLPQATDYQFVLNGNHSRGTWQYYLLGASNRLGLALPTSATDDDSGKSEFSLFNYFEIMGFRYNLNLSGGLGLAVVPQQTFILINQSFFGNKVKVKSARYSLDTALTKTVSPQLQMTLGVRPVWDFLTTDVDSIQFPAGGFTPFFDIDTAPRSVEKRKRTVTTGSAYFDVVYEPVKSVVLNPGVVYIRGATETQQEVDPRVNGRFAVSEAHTLKAAWGIYSQRPNPAFDAPDYGNPRLKLERANHYVVGWEYEFANNYTSDLQFYYKDLYNLVGQAIANPADKYDNNIRGRAKGAEILIRKNPSGRWDGSIAYGYSVSERKDPKSGEWLLSDFDKTHNANIVAKYKVTGKWTLGLKLQYLSGDLATNLAGGQFNQNTGRYVPIPAENPGILNKNDIRDPDFTQLDLRSDYDIWFDTWTLRWFAELQVAPFGPNVVGGNWNEDFSERRLVRGLPFLPNLGIKAIF